MKRHDLLKAAAWLAAVFLSAACVTETAEEMIETPGGSFPAASFEQGHVRIYVEAGLAERLEAEGAQGVAVKSVGGIGSVRMERTFPEAGKFEKRTREAGLHRWYDVWFDDEIPLTKAGLSLENLPGVAEVEFRPITVRNFDNRVVEIVPPDAVPVPAAVGRLPFDDPMMGQQWNYWTSGTAVVEVAGCDSNVYPVWENYTTGNPDVIVAVVDGGIDYAHEDLADNIWTDPDRPGGGVHGFNFVDNSVNILKTSHGTHVAGIIAAVNNNGTGVCGIAGGDYAAGKPGVRLMSCQIFRDDEDGGSSGAGAIKWGADHGAVISQNSWGYNIELDYVPKSDIAAIEYFNTYAGYDENGVQVGPMAGGIVVFAAGNDNRDFASPASCEEAVSVAALGPDYYRAYYSNYGDWVDIAAPGGDGQKAHYILSTLPDNKYGMMQGTSMACPHISGIAALIVSQYGGHGFTRAMLLNRLLNTVRDISAQNRNYPVGGLADALAAITAEGTIPPDPVTDFRAELQNANFIRFSLTVPEDEDDRKASSINIYYSPQPFSETVRIPYKTFSTETLQAGDRMEGILSGLDFETTYYLACEACDNIGNRSALSGQVVVRTGENRAPEVRTDDPLTFTLKSHESRRLNFRYSDPDGHGIHTTLEKGSAADSLLFLLDGAQQVEVNALRAEPGSYSATLHVFDDYEAETAVSYTYTVLPNHAPVVTGSVEDQIFKRQGEIREIDLTEIFQDADGEMLRYAPVSSDNDVLNLHIREGKLYVTALKYGYASAVIAASDARGESVSVAFRTLSRNGDQAADIYPTRITDGKLYVRPGEAATVGIRLLSETGTPVLDRSLPAAPFEPAAVDLSGLPAGVYSVHVQCNGQTAVQTIVLL